MNDRIKIELISDTAQIAEYDYHKAIFGVFRARKSRPFKVVQACFE